MTLLRRPRVSLSRLCADDAAAWRDLRQEAVTHHPEAHGDSHDPLAKRSLADFAADIESGHVLVASANGVVAGCMALELDRGAGRDEGEILAAYVRARHRGAGIGRRLLAALIDEACRQGLTRLTLTVAEGNLAARALYGGAGFRPTGDRLPRALTRDGQLLELVAMARVLRPCRRWGRKPQRLALQSAVERG